MIGVLHFGCRDEKNNSRMKVYQCSRVDGGTTCVVEGGCRCQSAQLRGYKKAQRRQITMELLGADPRPHHFAVLRDRTFRAPRPCQAPRLPRCSLHFNQSFTSLYFTCKGALTACRSWGDTGAAAPILPHRLTSLEMDFPSWP